MMGSWPLEGDDKMCVLLQNRSSFISHKNILEILLLHIATFIITFLI